MPASFISKIVAVTLLFDLYPFSKHMGILRRRIRLLKYYVRSDIYFEAVITYISLCDLCFQGGRFPISQNMRADINKQGR